MAGVHQQYGLSPRVRGNPLVTMSRLAVSGSIPACAGEPAPRQTLQGTTAVYPRVCGGTPPPPILAPPRKGLSPRVRGNQEKEGGATTDIRSIPACAGEPTSCVSTMTLLRVYPRVCGGTIVI